MMRQFYHNLILRAGNQIDPDAPALGVPPLKLQAFMAWCLRGGWRVVWLGVVISMLAGLTEVVSMQLLGNVVDAVAETSSEAFLSNHMGLVLACIFVLLVARPLLFGVGPDAVGDDRPQYRDAGHGADVPLDAGPIGDILRQ